MAADTAGPVRVLVVPADALRESDPSDPDAAYGNDIAYADDELPGQLYDRVGVDGTYAVLVDADYVVRRAVVHGVPVLRGAAVLRGRDGSERAVDCCAPDYASMLEPSSTTPMRRRRTRGRSSAGSSAGSAWCWRWSSGGAAGSGAGGAVAEDAQVADALRPSLQEEVVELSQTVAALPPAPAGSSDELSNRTRQVLDLVEEARHRLDAGTTMATARPGWTPPTRSRTSYAGSRTRAIELVAIDALRRGQPVPQRSAPCFFDPRHGPSVAERPFTPEFGLERQVPVCAKCAEEVDAGRKPAARTFSLSGVVKPYWEWDRYTRPYVNGYWQRHTFADQSVQRIRFAPSPAVSRPDKPAWGGIQFVWENDGGSGGSGGSGSGSGGRRFSGSSGSRSSFGGGSSSRSTRRSGGSRRF